MLALSPEWRIERTRTIKVTQGKTYHVPTYVRRVHSRSCWVVLVPGHPVEYFADRNYGGPEQSLREAIWLRNNLMGLEG